MLTVAAARIEQDRGNPKLISDLREAAKIEAGRRADGRDYHEEEQRRIGRQRTLMAMVPDTRAKDSLMGAMLQRAYDLMWDGDALACDALCEFLPSKDVERMFAAWESDHLGQKPRSTFYGEDQ
jgi:hypothetical protein